MPWGMEFKCCSTYPYIPNPNPNPKANPNTQGALLDYSQWPLFGPDRDQATGPGP